MLKSLESLLMKQMELLFLQVPVWQEWFIFFGCKQQTIFHFVVLFSVTHGHAWSLMLMWYAHLFRNVYTQAIKVMCSVFEHALNYTHTHTLSLCLSLSHWKVQEQEAILFSFPPENKKIVNWIYQRLIRGKHFLTQNFMTTTIATKT